MRRPFVIKPTHNPLYKNNSKESSAPVNVDLDPLSLSEDLSGKITVASKHAAIDFGQLVETIGTKDVQHLLKTHAKSEIVMPTNLLLELSRTNDIVEAEGNEPQFYSLFPFLLGAILGIATAVLLAKASPASLLGLTIAAFLVGGIAGFLWKEFYTSRLRAGLQKWLRELQNKIDS